MLEAQAIAASVLAGVVLVSVEVALMGVEETVVGSRSVRSALSKSTCRMLAMRSYSSQIFSAISSVYSVRIRQMMTLACWISILVIVSCVYIK